MRKQVFERYRDLIYRQSGISLSEEKVSLLLNRIRKRCVKLGAKDEEDYLDIIETNLGTEEITELIDAISTNVTHFYREGAHFEFLTEQFKKWSAEGKHRIRVWSAACSSGEEPYTIAMCAAETLPLGSIRFQLLATDICTKVLQKAMEGYYDHKQLTQLPQHFEKKYFMKIGKKHEGKLQIDPKIQSLVSFRQFNLSRFPYSMSGNIDVIFCRNVMIYFDNDLRQKIIDEFWRLLAPGGYLLVGHAEGLFGLKHQYHTMRSAIYRKPVS